MDDQTVKHLITLNHQFYVTFADSFSSTRQRLQPGVQNVLNRIPTTANLLDLGCGNGTLAMELAERGFQGKYTGLDFSPQLLETARQNVPPGSAFAFLQADLSSAAWDTNFAQNSFDYILAFAILHHIPGRLNRQQLLVSIRRRLSGGGLLVHSNWQFLNSERLRSRIQPWERAGIRAEDVEPGDYLLDWRHGGVGLRYVHHFTRPELDQLAEETGFSVLESFLSDGEGGNLGIYQIWHPR